MYYYSYLLLAMATILLLPLLVAKFSSPRKRKNLPPGPWRLPVIGSIHHLVGALPYRILHDLARRQDAPLMMLRLGELDVLVASSAAAAREIMKTHDAVFATRLHTATLHALTSDGIGIALAPHGEYWRQIRKLATTELLVARRIRSLRGLREAETAAMVASVASSWEAVNLSSVLSSYVTDVMVRAMLGHGIGSRGLRDEFLQRIDQGIKLAMRFSLADLFPSSRLALALSWWALRRAELHSREMSRLMGRIIEEHRRASARDVDVEVEEDFLGVLLRIQADDGGLDASLEDITTISAMVTDLFAAGNESSASTIEWAMTELMRNPAALQRATTEVRGALIGESRVAEEALPQLHYLHLVIKETLRLHPVAPVLPPRVCRQPSRILGYDVPQGAMVLVNVWSIGRDAASWGPDADEFRPERFEEGGTAAVDFRGTHFDLLPFGAGRRMCPGIAFALPVMELALASLLFHFDWELPGAGAEELDIAEQFVMTSRKKNDLWLNATLRVPRPPP